MKFRKETGENRMNSKIILKNFFKYILDSDYRFIINNSLGLTNKIDDLNFLKKKFKIHMGYELDLNTPKTYNEKLQWLKIYDRNPKYTNLVDKYEVKNLIASLIGEEYIIPTLGVWNTFDEIDFNILPNQFVLKCTHDSGGIVICHDKSQFDFKKAKKKLTKSLRKNYFYQHREWPYKNVKPRIIAEKYINDSITGELRDYKFFAFNGKVKAMFIVTNRALGKKSMCLDFYDNHFNHLPFTRSYPNADIPPEKPLNFEIMIELSEKLSVDIPHVRIDFYEVDEKIFFGEMTFFPGSGFEPFDDIKWDEQFGEWIDIKGI